MHGAPPSVMPANDNGGQEARRKTCAICGKETVAEFDPFCSARCVDVDLNRWLSGVYVVPGKTTEPDDEA